MAAAIAATSCRVWGNNLLVSQQCRSGQLARCNVRLIRHHHHHHQGSRGLLTLGRRREKLPGSVSTTEKKILVWDELGSGASGRHSSLMPQKYLKASSTDFSSAADGENSAAKTAMAASLVMPALVSFAGAADAIVLGEGNLAYGEVGAGLEFSVQLIYLGALIVLLGIGSFLVVRQVLIRRELEFAAKELQDRVRSGEASSEEYFELGAVMLRKKFFVLANKYLEQAIKKWDGDEADLAQVYNALGFSYFSDDKLDGAIAQYEKAVKLQPGYVTAWNNLGDAYEKKKDLPRALKAYDEALQFDPSNKIARRQRDAVKERVDRFRGIPSSE